MKEEGAAVDRLWEAKQHARELRQRNLEQEGREEAREEAERLEEDYGDKERLKLMLSDARELALSMVEMEEEHFDLHNNPAYEADIEL